MYMIQIPEEDPSSKPLYCWQRSWYSSMSDQLILYICCTCHNLSLHNLDANLGSLIRQLGCGINSSAHPIIGLQLMLKSFLARQAGRLCFLCSPQLVWLADSQWLQKHHRSICESAHHRTDYITNECKMLPCSVLYLEMLSICAA